MLVIRQEDPRQPDVEGLLHESDHYSASLYPPEARYPVNTDFLAASNVRFFVARYSDLAVGCGALVLGHDRTGELKRLIVRAAIRGQGIGRHLLATIEQVAVMECLHTLQLETGPQNLAALTLYQQFGYRDCEPFGNYIPGPHSVFMKKQLSC